MKNKQTGHVLFLAIVVFAVITAVTIDRVNYYANQFRIEGQLCRRFIRQAQYAIDHPIN